MTLINYVTRIHFADGVLEEALRSEMERMDRRRPLVVAEDAHVAGGIGERLYSGFPLRARISTFSDVPPFVTVAGNSASPRGLNTVGLRRRGFPASAMQALKSAYKVVYKRGLTLDSAVEQLAGPAKESAEVSRFLDFVRSSGRGIVR